MRRIIDYNTYISEGVRDLMTPKSDVDIKKALEPLMRDVARALTYMSNDKDIIGMEDLEEAHPFVLSKIDMVQELVFEYNYTDPEEIALFLAATYLKSDS
jgi:hypothetical protein